MELYANTTELAAFEAALAERTGVARLAPLVTLAWHLRQRETARAARLAGEALRLADEPGVTDTLLRAPCRAGAGATRG